MAQILIIEDEPNIAKVITAYLKKEGHTVFIAYDGTDGLVLFEKEPVDLVILDLMLPDISGEDVCRTIRRSSRIPVLMLTAKSDEASLLYGFRIGADDYLTKPFSPRELMVRIGALLRRIKSEPAAQIIDFENGAFLFDSGKRKLVLKGEKVHLTPIEFDILEMLISYPGRIFSREDIIVAVMGHDFDGEERTVDSHIRNLRSKIEDDPKNPHYIKTQRGRGFCFDV